MNFVAFCVPSGDTWKTDTALSFAAMCAYSASYGIQGCVINYRLCSIARSRNLHVFEALKSSFPRITHLMWVDSDMSFPARGLADLLAHDKDVVGAFYPQKSPPYATVGCPENKEDFRNGEPLIRADILGGGFKLVKREVYERLQYPWYEEKAPPDDPGGFVSEDILFSFKCRTAGIELWCDLDLSKEMGHCGSNLVRFEQSPSPL